MPRLISVSAPEDLVRRGPLLNVKVSLPQAAAAIRKKEPEINIVALLDTGASYCVISKKVQEHLELKPVGRMKTSVPSGDAVLDVCAIDFSFVDTDITVRDCQALVGNLVGQNCDMLIGRDLLSVCSLVYDGPTGRCMLELPRENNPIPEE